MPLTTKRTIILILAIAMIFVLVGTFILSYSFETLDKQAGKMNDTENPIYHAPFDGYNIPGLENTWGLLIVGVFGTLGLFCLGLVVAKIVHRKKSKVT